jgi:hypothetical protein
MTLPSCHPPPRRLGPPDPWIAQLFGTRTAREGGVVRRSVAWVEREVGHDRFIAEVRHRGFRLIRAGGQYVVICTPEPVQVLV